MIIFLFDIAFNIIRKKKIMQEQKLSSYFSSINEFSFINSTTIGKGSFGQVKLAFHLRTNKIYAIKIVHKSHNRDKH